MWNIRFECVKFMGPVSDAIRLIYPLVLNCFYTFFSTIYAHKHTNKYKHFNHVVKSVNWHWSMNNSTKHCVNGCADRGWTLLNTSTQPHCCISWPYFLFISKTFNALDIICIMMPFFKVTCAQVTAWDCDCWSGGSEL